MVNLIENPYPTLLPHSLKVYPIVQTAKEVGPQRMDAWPFKMKSSLSKWKNKTDHLGTKDNLIYVHIPFCPFLCHFCPLYKVQDRKNRGQDAKSIFVELLIKEIEMYGEKEGFAQQKFNAIYFGGGTPTELIPAQIIQILDALKKNFNITEHAEITLEGVAKQMLQTDYLKKCYEGGINRISFGVQSTDKLIRRQIGRGDEMEDYTNVIELSRSLNPKITINIDIMVCLPGQSYEKVEQDIKTVLSWELNSVDVLYFVMMPGTKMNKFIESGRRASPQYGAPMLKVRELVNTEFLNAGYKQVTGEVFVKSDEDRFVENSFGSSGNRLNTVLAVGPSAFGIINGAVYQNVCDFKEYIKNLSEDLFPVIRAERLTARTAKRRALLFSVLQLDIPDFLIDNFTTKSIIKKWKKQALLQRTQNGYKLTAKGALWYNHMQIDLMPFIEKLQLMKMMGKLETHKTSLKNLENNELKDYEKEFLKLILTKKGYLGVLQLNLFKLYLASREFLFFDNRAIGFTGVVE